MNIGLLSPTFPPDRCGVGDHSLRLKEALIQRGLNVQLFRSIPAQNELKSLDALLIQYTPNIWAQNKFRLNRDLVRFCRQAKKITKVFLLVHELHYPIQFNLRGLVFGVGQWMQFRALARSVDWLFFSYEAPHLKYPHHSSVLPVGSNIPFAGSAPETNSAKKPADSIRLLHFGGSHPTHLVDWTISVLNQVSEAFPNRQVDLIWIGQKDLNKNVDSRVQIKGYLGEEQISQEIRMADVVLAPFMDGVSTRRGTFMAALTHGSVVATTRGWATSPTIPWKNFCLISETNASQFGNSVVTLLQVPEQMEKLKANARTSYEHYFSWPSIAQKLIHQINVLSAGNS